MEGHHLTFFMERGQLHQGVPVAELLMQQIESLGIVGARRGAAGETSGRAAGSFKARFSGLGDQAEEISVAASVAELQAILSWLRAADIRLFYTFTQVDFGVSGRR